MLSRIPDPLTADPWIEVIGTAIEHNVRELHRYSGLRLIAVAKNNANGIGIGEVGAILDRLPEVYALAVVRVDEALALRVSGVTKPILMMAHVAGDEAQLLVDAGVRLTPFHNNSLDWLRPIADRRGRPIPIHVFVDTGMNRIGMPHKRAVPWISELAASGAVTIEGAYTMFSGAEREGKPFDLEHLRRFRAMVGECRSLGIDLGLLHGAPSTQVVHLPEAQGLDLIRPGGAIYGLDVHRSTASGEVAMDLKTVFRLRARISRVELIGTGEGVNFEHHYRATEPTWVATVPVGHTDGYPATSAGNSMALVADVLYPVIGQVSSNHTILEIGRLKTVGVGDVATLVGPDRVEISPMEIARNSGLERDYWIMTRLNALLHRVVVSA